MHTPYIKFQRRMSCVLRVTVVEKYYKFRL